MNDTSIATPEEIGSRIRETREEAGISRAGLGKMTGLSPKIILKIENAEQEATPSRLQSICQALSIDPAEFFGSTDVSPNVPARNSPPVLIADPFSTAANILEAIDQLREDGYEDGPRKALALADEAKRALSYLEPDALTDLARLRGVKRQPETDTSTVLGLFSTDPCEGQEICGHIEDRIVDTAVFGFDLWTVDIGAFSPIATQLVRDEKIEDRTGLFGGWNLNHQEMAPLVRPYIRRMAVSRQLPDGWPKQNEAA